MLLLRLVCGMCLAALCCAYDLVGISPQMQLYADAIIDLALAESNSTNSVVWQRLAYATDTFGPRLSGSDGLRNALTYVAATATADGLTVSTQSVMVPAWVRGNEWARMTTPRNKTLHFLGLGGSNSSQGRVISGQVMVVKSRAELDARASEVLGKIVVFNPPWVSYGANVGVRSGAAVWVAAYGGLAAIVKAVGPWGLQTPHTGGSATAAIPSGCVSMEDATQMQRMVDRGQTVTVELYMEAHYEDDAPSQNVIIDLPGTDLPNEFVTIGGHSDSWDVAEGAMDDGGGAFAAWHALLMVKRLGIQTRRTLRAVFWTKCVTALHR